MRVRDKSQISRSLAKFGMIAGKLITLAVVVFILWVVRASIAAVQEPIIANFNVDARQWEACMKVKASSETWASQVVSCVSKKRYLAPDLQLLSPPLTIANIFFFYPQGGTVEDCDAIPDVGTSMWTARVLSIIVKNMQSYIVAVVWGVAEVLLSLRKSKGNKIVSTRSIRKKGALPHHGPSSGLAKTNKASEREMNCHNSSSSFVLPHYTHEKLFLNFKIVWWKYFMRLRLVHLASFVNSLVA
jgi:hypothetical protein